MKLPKIGDLVTVEMMGRLMSHLGVHDNNVEVAHHPENFKPWVFDGVSGIPDDLLGLLKGVNQDVVTFECALIHDLQYAVGKPGEDNEKYQADVLFRNNLIEKAGMKPWLADVFLKAVEIGGGEEFGLSFSWGFARMDPLEERVERLIHEHWGGYPASLAGYPFDDLGQGERDTLNSQARAMIKLIKGDQDEQE